MLTPNNERPPCRVCVRVPASLRETVLQLQREGESPSTTLTRLLTGSIQHPLEGTWQLQPEDVWRNWTITIPHHLHTALATAHYLRKRTFGDIIAELLAGPQAVHGWPRTNPPVGQHADAQEATA